MTKKDSANGALSLEIPVGAKLALDINGIDVKLTSSLIGYCKAKYVVIQLPSLVESNKDLLFQYLYSGNDVTVRYLHSGAIFGFRCTIIKHLFSPFPLFFLTFPEKVESYNLRRHKRIPCLLPVTTRIGETSINGLMTDLSLSGCGVTLTLMRKYQPVVAVDDEVQVVCSLFGEDGRDCLRCQIKRSAADSGKIELGLKFVDLPETTRKAILSYIQSAAAILE